MFPTEEVSLPSKSSESATKRGLKALTSKTKAGAAGLAVDTSFSRHRGQVPEQLFPSAPTASDKYPYESQTQARRTLKATTTSLRALLENRQPGRIVPVRTVSDNDGMPIARAGLPARPDIYRYQTTANISEQSRDQSITKPALHKRIKGLRPSPLDLTDVSPSDRAIPIGIAVPSAAISDHTRSPLSGQRCPDSPHRRGLDAVTPTIVITPAKEDFGLSSPPEQSSSTYHQRPASSLYSGAPYTADFEATPPVPPLPLFALQAHNNTVPVPAATLHDDRSAGIKSHQATLSVCTVFEEDEKDSASLLSARSLRRNLSRRMTSQSVLPTPRRSRGWWNVVTSPFSARSNGMFWRSPVQDGSDKIAILRDASAMGTAESSHGADSCDRTMDDAELRSAPAIETGRYAGAPLPMRSMTAPGALDANASGVDIYRIPSQGEAAAYFDQSRHFPSLLVDSTDSLPKSVFEDESPLTDVCACERHNYGNARCTDEALSAGSTKSTELDRKHVERPLSTTDATQTSTMPVAPERSVFTTPTADELRTATPGRPTADRSLTQATMESQLSPLSATPVVGHAHFATVVGPTSSPGQPRAVIVTPGQPASLVEVSNPPSKPLAHSAIASYHEPPLLPQQASQRPALHTRNDSYGLGITSEKELFPPPQAISEKPRLMTDRFGQLTLATKEKSGPSRPWYRRFFWLLSGTAALFLLLLVVLLVMSIPQRHVDMAVEGQWLNLTAFSPLPTGITTVVQPNEVRQESGCVAPADLWSCTASQGQQPTGQGDQPNFRIEIRFRNSTTNALNATEREPRSLRHPGSASVRGQLLHARNVWSRLVSHPSPAPPSRDDQIFIGKTTDNITVPYNGEETPFSLSLLEAAALSGLQKRQENTHPYPYPTATVPANSTTNSDSSGSNVTTTASNSIPKAAVLSNGHPAPATLYPYAQAQPLRLYNRGADDEHYGFYTYFDRTLFVANASATGSAVCTWSQTRFHVQIWTRKQAALLASAASVQDPDSGVLPMGSSSSTASITAGNSTANDMAQPGSFPYPITITLDRHGGDAARKGLYCYGIDAEHKVTDTRMWVSEDRGFDGAITNAAAVPGSNGTIQNKRADTDGGGIDGGSGGCSCGWANWT